MIAQTGIIQRVLGFCGAGKKRVIVAMIERDWERDSVRYTGKI